MKTNSIRFKTSILYSGVLSLILGLFSVYLFGTVHHILYQEARQDLTVKARQIEVFLDAYAFISPQSTTGAFLMNQFLSASDENASGKWIIDHLWTQDSKSLGLANDFFRILSPRGRVRLRSDNMTNQIDGEFNAKFPLHPDSIQFTYLRFDKASFYGISYPFSFANRNNFVLQLATPIVSVRRVLSRLVMFIIVGIVAILLMTVFMGSFMTRRILKPVIDVTATANNISKTNLHSRIPQQRLDQEMEELVGSFNRMIERLEASFTHVNEFSTHVAHELKTPLAVIKNELELALAEGKSKEDDKHAMTVALEEIDRLIRTIKDMLLLAKLEYKLNIFKMEEININNFLREICEHARLLAGEKDIRLELSLPHQAVWVQGDVTHLRRIFFNLLHNATKFTPSGGQIKITSEVHHNQVFVSIKDNGIGIAPEHQSHIFEKFYRIRRFDQEDAGSGLGLCMARAVAFSHGGDITFESEVNQGSVFTVILPLTRLN